MNKIEAKVIADSLNAQGIRLATIECEFPRFILAEISKHRNLSISAQSTRAVPTQKLIQMTRDYGFVPDKFLQNQPGMQAKSEEVNNPSECDFAWREALHDACNAAEALFYQGVHKQWAGRVIEPFMWQRAVISATQWENFFRLRIHPDAQPELRQLAEAIHEAMQVSQPALLSKDRWHLPYVTAFADGFLCGNDMTDNLEDAKKYSAAKCASVSYRTGVLSLEKGLDIYSKLVESELAHSVPLEHLATPMTPGCDLLGITHIDRNMKEWSGNFKGWIQHRHIFEQTKGFNTYD